MSQAREHASEKWSDSEFKQVFLEHYPRIVNVLLRLLGDTTRAEEVANDTFWRLYQQAPLRLSNDHIGGWLYRTATNLGIDMLRASARRVRYENAASNELHKREPTGTGPLDSLILEERRTRVRAVLALIRPEQAQLLILRTAGLSYKELAEVLGVKPSGIGTLLNRAETEFRARHLQLYGKEKL